MILKRISLAVVAFPLLAICVILASLAYVTWYPPDPPQMASLVRAGYSTTS